MKRLGVMLLVAALLSVATPAAAEPGSLDPVVKALKTQFAKKSGVRFTVKRQGGPPYSFDMKGSGTYRFRASGVYAADTVQITREPSGGTGRSRGISIGHEFYSQSYVRSKTGEYTHKSPSQLGKWRHGRHLAGVIWGDDLINGINPGFLELAATTGVTTTDGGTFEGVKTTLHSGTVTVPVLGERQAGMFFDLAEDDGSYRGPIIWKLWVGPDNLPRRFHAIMRHHAKWTDDVEVETMTMNIIYRGWGTRARITAPPERLLSTDW
ncbi:hypothetical protein [Herbidospora sp. RD11066]